MFGFSVYFFGGSILVIQIEKYCYFVEGCIGSIGDKLWQMFLVSVCSYCEGLVNFVVCQDIVFIYFNLVLLLVVLGYGEVIGLVDGLWVWYGVDYWQVGEVFDGKVGFVVQGLVLCQVLVLMIVYCWFFFYLVLCGCDELDWMIDSYLWVLIQVGVIEVLLCDVVLVQKLVFCDLCSQLMV